MTLRTRDQVDIVGAVVAFHLSVGVDFVVATDHQSVDGTDEILEAYERAGVLRLVRVTGDVVKGQEWRTHAARLAATEHGADWTFSCDGDEFWWPRRGSLKDVFAAVPSGYGVVEAPWRFFLPRPEGPAYFAERMTVRLSPAAALGHPLSPFKSEVKVAHRALESVVVERGSHRLLSGGLVPLAGWHPIEVLHFPVRSDVQYSQRVRHWSRSGRDWWFAPTGAPMSSRPYSSLVVTDAELAEGLARGSLTHDVRVRDALRRLPIENAADERAGARPVEPFPPTIRSGPPTAAEELGWAVDRAVLEDRTLLRVSRRLDAVSARLSAVERRDGSAGGRVG
jgi:hypothetical protein